MDEYDRKQARSIIDNYLGRLQDDHEEKSKQLAEMEDALEEKKNEVETLKDEIAGLRKQLDDKEAVF